VALQENTGVCWYNPQEGGLCLFPSSTGGEFFSATVQRSTVQREEVRKMRPEEIVAMALKAAASILEEIIRQK